MRTTRQVAPKPRRKQLSIQVDAEQLDRLGEIAATEYRNLSQKVRAMIEAEVARHEEAS